jgi:hypothetical protein
MTTPTNDPYARTIALRERARSMRRWRIAISSAAVVLGVVLLWRPAICSWAW